ncbi:MAG: ribonuclease HII [Chloroflexi bacterium]|nr:MAG: ribonuclease HII [Chloroflexota bacterium]
MIVTPTLDAERELQAQGYRFVAGVDEAGRGAIAGPVAAAAVVLPVEAELPWLSLVRDSKQLSPRVREYLSGLIQESGIAVGVGMVSPADIDGGNIVKATRAAMRLAVSQLDCDVDFLLIDALTLPDVALPQRGIVRGDQTCLSIACASIVAKVSRDRYMRELDTAYPGYGLACHKGYPTRQHLSSLRRLGCCAVHRRSFAPVRRLIEG